jgi:hypothetical protein
MTTTTPTTAELTAAVQEVLDRKGQPMTASQVRDNLPRRFREQAGDIGRCLEDLAAQGRLHAWPAFRSKAARYATRPMDEAARQTLTQLLAQEAFTRSELVLAVCREVPGLPKERCDQLVEEVLSTSTVRKLPPRLGGTNHMLGTPHPRSYLAPLFDNLAKSLARLLPRLESEGVSRTELLQEASSLWQQTLRQAEQDAGGEEATPEPARSAGSAQAANPEPTAGQGAAAGRGSIQPPPFPP